MPPDSVAEETMDDGTMPPMPAIQVIVRMVSDAKTHKVWFEEKNQYGQWRIIESTKRSCEGNARHQLCLWVERRRAELTRIMRTYGEEETFQIF